jgi:hypothetical protein
MTYVHRLTTFHLFICLLCALFGGHTYVCAQEAFTPPQAYALDRYEEGWNKNPFTLKTAPVALVQRSFAEDMAIGSFYGTKDNPTIVVVNTKTRKRWPIKKGQTAENGMTLDSWSISASRRETSAVVKLNGEKAELRFDDSFVKEMAASTAGPGAGASRGAMDPARPGAQGRPRLVGDVASDTAPAAEAAEARSSFPVTPTVADAGTGSAAPTAGYTPSPSRRMKFTSPIPSSHLPSRRAPLPPQ